MAYPLFCVLVLYLAVIFMQSSSISSKNTSTLSVGDSLLANSSGTPILSPSGDFAFGFHSFPINNNTTVVANDNTDLFLLSIWYHKIPNVTIVWYANDGNPVEQGSKLTVTANEGLILSDPHGNHLWNTTTESSSRTSVSYGFMNDNGVLTWYSYLRDSIGDYAVWSEIQSVPDNICMNMATYGGVYDSGVCGYNSICHIDNQKPVCKCPPNYSLMDPNDINGSCEPDFKLDVCENVEDAENNQYEMIPLQNTNWLFGDYARLNTSSEEECKNSCLNDCFCAAAIFAVSSCWKKRPPLSNGRYDSLEPSRAWLKVGLANAASDPHNSRYKKNDVIRGMLGGSVTVNFILFTAIVLTIVFKHTKRQSRGYDEHQRESLLEHNSVHRFTYRKLESATNRFREEIGRGSFGVVYKGMITVGGNSTTVAVKKLDQTFKGANKEFMAEVNAIGLTHHRNLVRFIGYCKEEDKRLLVFEYMPNGTIADYLFGDSRPSWQSRIQIAQGVARGLLYLHEDCTTQIIHCDIKPQNILVDDHYDARISDFGLAKLLALNQSQTNTAVRGTKGYVAPEWFKNKPISMKVDVYSFGVLLLEIVCCRRCVCMEQIAEERAILTDWAFDCYQSGKMDSLVDDDMEALNDWQRLERFVKVGLWCIQEDPNLRPTMQRVNQMLDGVAEVPDPPCQTSFSVVLQD